MKRVFQKGEKVKLQSSRWMWINEGLYGLDSSKVYTVYHYYEHDTCASIMLEGNPTHFDSAFFVKVDG